jgi:serine/threonine protein kinase
MSSNKAEIHAARQFKVGEEIFSMKSVLGKGTFGTVFLATRDISSMHNPHDREVAIKEIARSNIPKAFPAEAAILKHLQHPNIVHLYNVDDSYSDYIYLVLEFCEGGDLKSVMQKQGRLPDYLCRRLFQDLTSGLHFLYERRLIHRDIKPQNLLLSEPIVLEYPETDTLHASRFTNSSSITLKIADFGSARYLHESSMAFTVCGSPLYMAPEILQCQSYDHKCDLWSAGVVLYEMLCGAPLFLAHSEADLLRQVRSFRGPKFHQGLQDKEKFQNLLNRLLVIDPRNRIDYDEFIPASHKLVNDRLSNSANNISTICLSNDQTDCTPISTHNVNSSAELLTLMPSLNLVDDFLAEFEACSLPCDALPISDTIGLKASKVEQSISESSTTLRLLPLQSSTSLTVSQRKNVTHHDGLKNVAPQNFETEDTALKPHDSNKSCDSSRPVSWARLRYILCFGILIMLFMVFCWEVNLLMFICVNSPWPFVAIHRVNDFLTFYLGFLHPSSFIVSEKDFRTVVSDTDVEAISVAVNRHYRPHIFLGLDSCPVDGESIEKCSIEEFENLKLDLFLPLFHTVAVSQDDYHKSEDVMALTPSSRCLGTVSMMKDDDHNEMEIPTSPPPGWDTTPSELSRILRVSEFLFLCISVILLFFHVRESIFILNPCQVVAKVNVILPERSLSDSSSITNKNKANRDFKKSVKKELGWGKRIKIEHA